MIKVLFFTQVCELVGTNTTEVVAGFLIVGALRQHLVAQSDRWALALEDSELLVVANQTLVNFGHSLANGNEVALFLPVIGS